MVPYTIQFYFYLSFLIPSIPCTIFVLYHLLFNRTLRTNIQNHTIIVLLFIGFIQQLTIYPWMLYYFFQNGIWQRPLIFCEFWGFFDWGAYIMQTVLFAWTTIERHILIFHERWVGTRKKRIFVHYLPLTIILLYCLILYTMVFFFPPCANSVKPERPICVNICIEDNYAFFMWETIATEIVPVILIVIFSLALFVRVIWQKYRIRQPIIWRRHRKMVVQILSISSVYMILSFPVSMASIISIYGTYIDFDIWEFTLFLCYFTYLIFPFVCALSVPEIRSKIENILRLRCRVRGIYPATLPIVTRSNRQMTAQ